MYSQVPNSPRAYSTYLLEVEKEGYDTVIIEGVQILPCIEVIQNISLSKVSNLTKSNVKVNKAIKAMHEDGTFTELSKKWFGLDTTKE